jgi:hypothetical protein
MDDTFEARATAMARHCARVAAQAEEFEAQAVQLTARCARSRAPGAR